MCAAARNFLFVGLLSFGCGAPASATSLLYVSGSQNDFITGGNTYSYSDGQGYFTPYWSSDGFVHLRFDTNDATHYWDLVVGGPIVGGAFTGPLQANNYYSVDPNWQMANENSANIGFSGDYRTYGGLFGGFTLYDLSIENNALQRFAIQFDITDTSDAQQNVKGYVWMNSDAALPTDFPGSISVPEPGSVGLMAVALGLLGVARRHTRGEPTRGIRS